MAPVFLAALLAWIGFMISQSLDRTKTQESQQQHYENAVVTKRMILYDEIGRNIDGLYSYYFYVGRWKEITPDEILQKLRGVDDVMFTYQPIFSKPFFDNFIKLRDEMFQKNNRWGEDLKLRTTSKFHKKYGKEWHGDWDKRFTNEDNRKVICAVYNDFLTGLGSRLIKSTIQERRRGRQRPGNFARACRSGLRRA